MQQPPQHPGGKNPAGAERGSAGERSQRRMPPPDATGQESDYLAILRENKTPVTVEMLDGQMFHGVVEYYDRDVIKVNRPDGLGPNVLVRKKYVRSLLEGSSE
jgi:sRNA-binding regulator protein Hfq